MKVTTTNYLKLLRQCVNRFDAGSDALRLSCLRAGAKTDLKVGKKLVEYHDLLLFMLAHPASAQQQLLAEGELKRLSTFLKKSRQKERLPENSGLPHGHIHTRFSHDMLCWLHNNKFNLSSDAVSGNSHLLSDLLKLTLPSSERELCTYGFNDAELLEALRIRSKEHLVFLLQQFEKLNDTPLTKDYFFEQLELDVTVSGRDQTFSRGYNRFLTTSVFYHNELVKRFDHRQLLNTALPTPVDLQANETDALIATVKKSLVLTARETDPATYLLPQSLRYYALERGIAIAIYGMTENRQLPFESYVGYTLFKNGFPAAYGGAWVFGRRALFGMNIFESFRGGESGYMMCQLLRVYRQAFKISSFEIEPYQFGKDNPDGIASGAFWFYYRFGFRPLDRQLEKLAAKEHAKISAGKGYQSSYQTLERFTDSFICLELETTRQPKVSELSAKITACIARHFAGNHAKAELQSRAELLAVGNIKQTGNALGEYALLWRALQLKEERATQLIAALVNAKPYDLYAYQALLLEFFEHIRQS